MARAAIVEYGLGNLFSVQQACEHVGLDAAITDDPAALAAADVVVLPGVGAFADAMAALGERDLVAALQDLAAAGKPLVGICLGLQLLMGESHEFGTHAGLGLVPGTVERLPGDKGLKVPQVGWRPVHPPAGRSWDDGPLAGVAPGTHLYFVHSYYVRPEDPSVVLAQSDFGGQDFCAALWRGNLFACQFHPERSAEPGLRIYRTIAAMLDQGALHE
ncbi:MAG: imidazole glycerol phosphate synthase subunit HisH [Rhodobacterales bacterium]|nr:imidazole glycerol phosphate synthase subunit HisH [Rhodobacterales bacterium]